MLPHFSLERILHSAEYDAALLDFVTNTVRRLKAGKITVVFDAAAAQADFCVDLYTAYDGKFIARVCDNSITLRTTHGHDTIHRGKEAGREIVQAAHDAIDNQMQELFYQGAKD